MSHSCSFLLEIDEASLFFKCLNRTMTYAKFYCTPQKVVISALNVDQNILIMCNTLPYAYTGDTSFEVQINIKDILKVFNIYRKSTKSDETISITIDLMENIYTLTILEKKVAEGIKYDVKFVISDTISNESSIDISCRKLPNIAKKVKLPVRIIYDILTNMSADYTYVNLICTNSSIIIKNRTWGSEILDETIFSYTDLDTTTIKVKISDIMNILDASKEAFIDTYFTNENIILFTNQHDQYLYTFDVFGHI
jgi:hypothetical protein